MELRTGIDLLSDRESNEAYATAQRGRGYVVYFPDRGSVELKLGAAPGPFTVHWIHVGDGAWGDKRSLRGEPTVRLEAPGDGGWLAVLTDSTGGE